MKIIMVDSLVGNDYSICLCNSLYENGIDLHLIVPKNREIQNNNTFKTLYFSPSKSKGQNKLSKIFEYLYYMVKAYKYIKNTKPDVVHYQFFRRKSEIFFYKFLQIMGIKLVFTAHNVLPHEKNRLDYLLKYIVYKNSQAIIVHSQYIKEKLLNNFKINKNKVSVIPHGNFDIYLPQNELSEKEARDKLGLSDSDNVILFFGFIREYKGLDLLLEAFNLAAANDKRLKLLIAGKAHTPFLENKYKKIIDNSNFKDRIYRSFTYIANEDIPTYFLASDTVILPYTNIDHSGIIHLAFTFGKPVIATNVGDFGEVIEQNKSGLILKSNDTKELAENINSAFSNKDDLVKMGIYAKKLSTTKYSWGDIARNTISLYKSLN